MDLGQGGIFECPGERLRLFFSHIISDVPRVTGAIGVVKFVQGSTHPIAGKERLVELFLLREEVAAGHQQYDQTEKQPEKAIFPNALDDMVVLSHCFR